MENSIKCMFPRRVDSELVSRLPIVKCPHEITLIELPEQVDEALDEIQQESLLGFDTETRPSFSKNLHYKVSVLQLCGKNKAWIFRLIPLEERIVYIYKILENQDIKKVGLAVQGDIKALSQRRTFQPNSFIDVSRYSSGMGIINTGMKNLAALFLGVRVSKSSQMSNWEAEELTQKQIDYAATDAWISRLLYLEVKKVIDENNYEVEPEPEPVPEPLSFSKIFNLFCNEVKSAYISLKKKLKKLFHKKPPKKKKRRKKRAKKKNI